MRRDTTRDDFDDVYEIYMSESVNPYVNFEIMGKDEFRPIFSRMLSAGGFKVYELDGEVIAAYVITRFHERLQFLAYIGALGIKQEFQGQGHGTRMMQAVIQNLRADGVRRIELRVEADNPQAIHFYKKLGFEMEGTHRKYMKRAADSDFVDTHLMGLLLDQR